MTGGLSPCHLHDQVWPLTSDAGRRHIRLRFSNKGTPCCPGSQDGHNRPHPYPCRRHTLRNHHHKHNTDNHHISSLIQPPASRKISEFMKTLSYYNNSINAWLDNYISFKTGSVNTRKHDKADPEFYTLFRNCTDVLSNITGSNINVLHTPLSSFYYR